MAVPVAPTLFNIYYIPAYFSYYADITAGGSTHTGFTVYEFYSGSWHATSPINTTSTTLTEEYLGSFTNDDNPTLRIVAFNTDGESTPFNGTVTVPKVPPVTTPTPTNLQYTRDGLNVTVTWDGTLVGGDSWTVRLVDPAGYGDTISTVTANTKTLLTGRWINRTVRVYPTNTPENEATLTITKSIPTHTAVTSLASTIVSTNGVTDVYSVTFTCDWLKTAFDDPMYNYPSGFVKPVVRVFYSLTGDDSTQVEEDGTSLGGDNFSVGLNLAVLPEGQYYLVTVEVETVEATSPRPTHVATVVLEADLTSLSLTHVSQNNWTDNTTDGSLGGSLLYRTDLITLTWVQTSGVLDAEFESKIDDSAWVPLLAETTSGAGSEDRAIHTDHKYGTTSGTYPTSPDYTGDNRLDHTHFYQYSDGLMGDETTSNLRDTWFPSRNLLTHTVKVRGRKVGDVSWTESNEVVSVLRSIWHVKTKEPGWVEREFTDDVGLDGSRYRTYEGEQRPAVKYKTPDGIGLISHPPGVMVTPDQYIRAYVAGKSVQMLFTLDRGVTGHDLTDLQTGPQSWTATASSSTSGRTPDKAINGLTGADNSWQGATVYSGRGHVLTTADWWQCDLGAATMICGVRFWYAQPPGFRIYGSLTGAFTGEEVLMHTETDFYIALEKVLFYESHTVRYVRIYIDRLDTEGAFLTEPYAHAVMHEVGFYFGDLTYNSAYVDIETPAWAKHWFAAIPREKLDGISHLLRFKWVVTNPDTSVWHVFETPDFPCTLPTQDSIALPPSHVNIIRVS